MAPQDVSRAGFFSRLDAKSRIGLLFAGIFVVILLIYFLSRYLGGDANTTGPSKVANAPAGLQSVPGGQLTAEYQRALIQANTQAAQQAQMKNVSAVPTQINIGNAEPSSTNAMTQCNIICTEQATDVRYLLDDWVKQGKLAPDVATQIEKFAASGMSVGEFSSQLDRLVKDNKLSPEQARELLAQYEKKHANDLLQESAKLMDGLIKGGSLPLDAANELLSMQKNKASPQEYGDRLNQLVQQGKISSPVAQQLLTQYKQQYAREMAKEALVGIQSLAKAGEISPEAAAMLADLPRRGASPEEYAAAVQNLVAAGKLTPAAAAKLLMAYNQTQVKPLSSSPAAAPVNVPIASDVAKNVNDSLARDFNNLNAKAVDRLAGDQVSAVTANQAKTLATNPINDLANNQIKALAADQLNALAGDSIKSLTDNQIKAAANNKIDDLLKTGKIKINTASQLKDLIQKNVSPDEYEAAINQLVRDGNLAPQDAKRLIDSYRAQQNIKDLAAKNVSPQEYAAAVNQLARQGQITGDEAKRLIASYQAQQGLKDLVSRNASSQEYAAAVNRLVRQGSLSAGEANRLIAGYQAQQKLKDLAARNVPPEEYAAAVSQLARQGAISAEEANRLMAGYQTQQGLKDLVNRNASPQEYAAAVNQLAQEGKISAEQANRLIAGYQTQQGLKDLVNRNASPEEYAAAVNQLVRQGKMSAAEGNRLITGYNAQQQLKDLLKRNPTPLEYAAAVNQLAREGKISSAEANRLIAASDAQQQLKNLVDHHASPDEYAAAVNQLVRDGKLSSEEGNRLLAASQVQQMLKDLGQRNVSPEEYEAAVNQLVRQGKISPEQASTLIDNYLANKQLKDMASRGVPVDQYAAAVSQLVRDGKISADDAKQLITDYSAAKQLQDVSARLNGLQARNASPEEYAAELKKAVQAGQLTQDQANQLMQQYQATLTAAKGAGGAKVPQSADNAQLAAAQAQAEAQAEADEKARTDDLANAMSSQAGQLIGFWQPPVMSHRGNSVNFGLEDNDKSKSADNCKGSNCPPSSSSSSSSKPLVKFPLVKAGAVMFAVLDTEANSDYPDSPIMATIVLGPLKGAKLLGKLVTAKGPAGQMDRVSLNFSLMNRDDWPTGKSITAYAIDPDTARVVMASSVNYHYLMRYGAIMATSFIQGYAQALNTSGANTTTGIFGTSTTHPELSPGQKLAFAMGQIGQDLGSVTKNYINIPPTVKVDSGVSLGILFMSDVTE